MATQDFKLAPKHIEESKVTKKTKNLPEGLALLSNSPTMKALLKIRRN